MPELFPTFKKIYPTNIKNKWLRYALYIIVGIFIFWFTYSNLYLPRQDKLEFAELEKNLINALQNANIKDYHTHRDCGRSKEVYGRGALICEIEIKFDVENESQSSDRIYFEFKKEFGSLSKTKTKIGFDQTFKFNEIFCFINNSSKDFRINCAKQTSGYIF